MFHSPSTSAIALCDYLQLKKESISLRESDVGLLVLDSIGIVAIYLHLCDLSHRSSKTLPAGSPSNPKTSSGSHLVAQLQFRDMKIELILCRYPPVLKTAKLLVSAYLPKYLLH